MTEQQSPTPPPAAPAAPAPPPAQPVGETVGEKPPPWGPPENFDAAKAWELIQNLRTEKNPDQQLRTELDSLKQAQAQQRDALAAALGIKPEETSDADKLARQVSDLQEQFANSRLEATRLTVAQNNGIPPEFQGWLTATDADTLDQQAKSLLPMVQATLAARGQAPLTAHPGVPALPVFQPHPGQGQAPPINNGAPSYADFYDEHGRPRS